jgi:hypothetical protein
MIIQFPKKPVPKEFLSDDERLVELLKTVVNKLNSLSDYTSKQMEIIELLVGRVKHYDSIIEEQGRHIEILEKRLVRLGHERRKKYPNR